MRSRSGSSKAVDEAFVDARASQVSEGQVGATRTVGQGWFKGRPERSVKLEVSYIPGMGDASYEEFVQRMDRIAERLATKLCQDSVIVIHDDGERRRTKGAESDE